MNFYRKVSGNFIQMNEAFFTMPKLLFWFHFNIFAIVCRLKRHVSMRLNRVWDSSKRLEWKVNFFHHKWLRASSLINIKEMWSAKASCTTQQLSLRAFTFDASKARPARYRTNNALHFPLHLCNAINSLSNVGVSSMYLLAITETRKETHRCWSAKLAKRKVTNKKKHGGPRKLS